MVLRDGMNVLPTHWNWHPAMFDMYLFTPLSQLRIVLHCIWLLHSEESLFSNKHLWPLLLFFWLKWAGYLAVAGLNLLAQISDSISPFGV